MGQAQLAWVEAQVVQAESHGRSHGSEFWRQRPSRHEEAVRRGELGGEGSQQHALGWLRVVGVIDDERHRVVERGQVREHDIGQLGARPAGWRRRTGEPLDHAGPQRRTARCGDGGRVLAGSAATSSASSKVLPAPMPASSRTTLAPAARATRARRGRWCSGSRSTGWSLAVTDGAVASGRRPGVASRLPAPIFRPRAPHAPTTTRFDRDASMSTSAARVDPPPAGSAGPTQSQGALGGDRQRLVLASALMLFVELALIRWTGANVVYLSYFSNFVLLGSFLGIGLGFLRGSRGRDLFWLAPVALAGLVAFVFVFPVTIERGGSDIIYFGSSETAGLPTWLVLPIIFLAVALVLGLIAQRVARIFARFAPLEAYRLDIAGSIAGIVAFTLLSFLRAPPVAWGVVAALVFWLLSDRRVHVASGIALVALVAMLGWESLSPASSWSPYYEVTVEERGPDDYFVDVNGIPHQRIESTERRREFEPIYFEPYERAGDNPLREVLVVGAGNGSDVAIALEAGAQHVDAVEIDPRLAELGEQLHPDRPYDDPRVDLHIDDGRAFLERTETQYDLILFALPDSLTLVSGQSSLRLESYLFTTGAMASAREHLAPGGTFAMYNFYREAWLVDRLASTLAEVYGHDPCVETVQERNGLALLSIGLEAGTVDCPAPYTPLSVAPPAPVTDDYPFLYLRSRGLPGFYLGVIGLILVASLGLVRAVGGPLRGMRPYADLFAMGVAFLLLETKSVVQFALLFGTTWVVNALVFTGVLLAVYLAVELARRVRLPDRRVLYGLLLASLALAFVVPSSFLLSLPGPARFVVAVAVAFAPIFVANLVFAERFADTAASTTAFGANLLGAMVGGLLEYLSLITGYRVLLLVVALAYAAAFVLDPRSGRAGTGAGSRARVT